MDDRSRDADDDAETEEWGRRDRTDDEWHDDPPTAELDPDPSGGDPPRAAGASAPDDGSDGPTLWGVLMTTLVSVGLIILGGLVGGLGLTAAAFLLAAVAGINVLDDVILQIVLGLVFLQGIGFGVAALTYLRYYGLGLEYVRARTPDVGDLAWTVIGFVAAFGLLIAGNLLITALGFESEGHSLSELAQQDPNLLLVLIPLSFLLIGPGEELLFRGVIQTAFVDRVGVAGGIVATSAIFALIHLPNYGGLDGLPTIGVLFVVSLVFGYTYERTDNLFVPAMIHAAYNAVQFFLLYVALRYAPESVAVLFG